MMKCLTAIMALVVAAPTLAQDSEDDFERERDRFLRPDIQTGTRFRKEPETASESDARQMQKRLAKCVYYGEREMLDDLLVNSDFERIDFDRITVEPDKFFDEIDFGRCLGRAMKGSQYKVYASMRYSTLRNLVAEEAYLYANKSAPVRDPAAPTIIAQRYAIKTDNPRTGALAEVADCITYRDAATAHDLLDSTPGTSNESDALEKLYPTVLVCLEAEEDPGLSTSMVRQMVADGMWSRSYFNGFAAAPSQQAETD